MNLTRRALCIALSLAPIAGGLAPARAAGLPLVGMRHDGRPLAPDEVRGWRLVYFGYTRCPDVCPAGLQSMTDAIEALGPIGQGFTPVFVTVDPERDTVEVMREYVAYFHPRFIGVTPSAAELETMAQAWRVKYAKADAGPGKPYLVDHTAAIFLVDPTGAIAGRLSHSLDGQQIAAKIRAVLGARS